MDNKLTVWLEQEVNKVNFMNCSLHYNWSIYNPQANCSVTGNATYNCGQQCNMCTYSELLATLTYGVDFIHCLEFEYRVLSGKYTMRWSQMLYFLWDTHIHISLIISTKEFHPFQHICHTSLPYDFVNISQFYN